TCRLIIAPEQHDLGLETDTGRGLIAGAGWLRDLANERAQCHQLKKFFNPLATSWSAAARFLRLVFVMVASLDTAAHAVASVVSRVIATSWRFWRCVASWFSSI